MELHIEQQIFVLFYNKLTVFTSTKQIKKRKNLLGHNHLHSPAVKARHCEQRALSSNPITSSGSGFEKLKAVPRGYHCRFL
jgi:hypothetical protein